MFYNVPSLDAREDLQLMKIHSYKHNTVSNEEEEEQYLQSHRWRCDSNRTVRLILLYLCCCFLRLTAGECWVCNRLLCKTDDLICKKLNIKGRILMY